MPSYPSTVGRGYKGKTKICLENIENQWIDNNIHAYLGDSLDFYSSWDKPTVIISDGAYGILGFEGDTPDYKDLQNWYEPHIKAWSKYSLPSTTLWFWNSEIGWASIHPMLEKYGWNYVNANIWNKGKAHIAGNVNTQKIRRFPVVTEMCVQYTFNYKIRNMTIKEWLLSEWKRTKLTLREANIACGVSDVATRKYFDQGHLWYFPPTEMFIKLQDYANKNGDPIGKPYYSLDGINPTTAEEWSKMRAVFNCPLGFTNVWDRPPLKGTERLKLNAANNGKSIHLNQKPLDLLEMIIQASSMENDIIWEPFGGLFSASIAAKKLGRISYGAEINPIYFAHAIERLQDIENNSRLLNIL